MTWQRIDENTYIDDTLVTCAEYQLFLDEMREQGKYYQPDYWSSLQFSKGQAKNPILGVRFGEAEIFCEWLTLRENSEWRYRVPIKEETNQHSLMVLYKAPLGYWVSGAKENRQEFAWLGIEPVDVRLINKTPKLEVPFSFNLNLEKALAQASTCFLDLEFSVMKLESSLRIIRKLSREIEFLHIIELARSRTQDIRRYITRSLYIKIDIYRAQKRSYEIAQILNNLLVSNTTQNRINEFPDKLGRAIDNICKVIIDLYTLQERIAGRSPAFEGIRLVKERIK